MTKARQNRLAAVDAAVARGLDDTEAGRAKPADEVFDRLEAKYCSMALEPMELIPGADIDD